jgi:hypothetical protein
VVFGEGNEHCLRVLRWCRRGDDEWRHQLRSWHRVRDEERVGIIFEPAQHRVQVVVEDERRDSVPDHSDAARDEVLVKPKEPVVDQPAPAAEGRDGREALEGRRHRVVAVEDVGAQRVRLKDDPRERDVIRHHGRHATEDVEAHGCLQPKEKADGILGNLPPGRPREDAQVRTTGGLVGIEDFPHPNHGNLMVERSTGREREREMMRD